MNSRESVSLLREARYLLAAGHIGLHLCGSIAATIATIATSPPRHLATSPPRHLATIAGIAS